MFTPETLRAVNRDPRLLFSGFLERIERSLRSARQIYPDLTLFEGWRTPQRQDWLYAQGRTRQGAIVTGARAWQSYHQFGIACDIALYDHGKWSWDFAPDKIASMFTAEGLSWGGDKDPPHFQMTGGISHSVMRGIVQSYGLQMLWLEIEAAMKKG